MGVQTIKAIQQIILGDITIAITRKTIKNLHLRVRSPNGQVEISAPLRMSLDQIHRFALSKLSWIQQQQQRIQSQPDQTPKTYIDRESHYLWGKRYLLSVIEANQPPRLDIQPNTLVLQVRPGSDQAHKQAVMDAAQRQLLHQAIAPLISQWEAKLGVSVASFTIRKMKTKWGSCSPQSRRIRFNLDLVQKPPICLEYVVVHELVHLLEPSHNHRFKSLMDQAMPQWRSYRDLLNASPTPAQFPTELSTTD
jgi:predicted metal-dependent hydrolase